MNKEIEEKINNICDVLLIEKDLWLLTKLELIKNRSKILMDNVK